MLHRLLIAGATLIGLLVPGVQAHDTSIASVRIEILDDAGRRLPTWPARVEPGGSLRTWLQAHDAERYRLRIHNPGAERLGLVIAIDGRNVISGERSELDPGEPMYIIDAYQTQVITGWRTDVNHAHAFYFTDQRDSYAGAWNDYSAMGTIAVSAFREHRSVPALTRHPYPHRPSFDQRAKATQERSDLSTGDAMEDPVRRRSADRPVAAGTGFGERHWSSVRQVTFDARRAAVFRQVFKYEWRETLCARGVVACETGNRLWPAPAFAPYPPG